jgi:deoxyribose-phosphate aldolase
MVDLTTLEGSDTPGKVRHLCAKAVCPAPTDAEIPSVAAVCVYPSLVGVAKEALDGHGREGRLGLDRRSRRARRRST